MILGDSIKKMLKDSNMTFRAVADKLGLASQNGVAQIVSRNNAQVSKLLEITDALDYEIIIRPKYGDNKAQRTIVLTSKED